MITYAKLWLMLKEKDMKRTDLLKIISAPTLAKLGKNQSVSVSIIEKICEFLECQPGDIMTYVTEKNAETVEKEMNEQLLKMLEIIKTVTGQTTDEILEEFQKEMPDTINKIKELENNK